MSEGPIQRALTQACARHSERRALVYGRNVCSYGELSQIVQETARMLRALLPDPPRPVGFCLKNSFDYVTLYFGALEAGYLPLLMDANFNTGEIQSIHDDCSVSALVVDRARLSDLAKLASEDARELAGGSLLLRLPEAGSPAPYQPRSKTSICRFTSGTTGKPKCIEFSGQAVESAARNWVEGTGMRRADRTLCLAALSNGLAFNTSLLATFVAGAELHLFKGLPLTKSVARWIAENAITRLVAFPTLYRNFVAPGGTQEASLASLKHAISAGAPLWPDVREEFRLRFGLDISDYYGIAETGPCTFERDPDYHTGLGQPLPGVELRIDSASEEQTIGEILVRTESMASGYLNHPGLFEERIDAEGFYHSGDQGRIDDGRLHLVGRTQDHINVAGRKIDPVEVASVVLDLDSVTDAVAFPDEDLHRETMVHLVVVPADPELKKNTLIKACRSRLASYKIPGRISFVDAIPRTGIGKPRIAVLREQLLEKTH